MHRLIDFSLRNKFLVLMLTAVMVGAGIHSMLRLPIDAVPDVTPNQVLVLTQAPGLGPVEVERFITFPVETAMSGLPGITEIRSVSRFGLSSVYIYFEEDLDIYFARRLVMERLPEAREAIPGGLRHADDGPDQHRPRRDLPVRGAGRGAVADGAAQHPRMGHRLQAALGARRRRGELLRRRAEDLRGAARPGQARVVQRLPRGGVRGAGAEQRQRRRRLHRARAGAVRHSRRRAGRDASPTSTTSSSRRPRTARRSTSRTSGRPCWRPRCARARSPATAAARSSPAS